MKRQTRELAHGALARKKLMEGVEEIALAVGSTLGPRGSTVVIQNPVNDFLPPTVTKDGVTVAKNIDFENPYM